MASILDMVQQQLGGQGINQISQQIGADPGTTQSAIQTALPMLLGGLAQNASQPRGADALHAALDDHRGTLDGLSGLLGGALGGATGGSQQLGAAPGTAPGNALGGLGGMLGGAGGGGLADMIGGAVGGKILGHILGGRRTQVEQGVAQQTGLDQQQIGKLLMILAPIVMGVLARRKQQQNLTPTQLGTELQQSQQQARQQQPGLGGLLGQIFGH